MFSTIKLLNKDIPRLGMGCWAIGGTWGPHDLPLGWSDVHDEHSITALHKAYDMGIRLFDTAATYGYGHSESILGQAFKDRRHDILLATKFGYPCDDEKKIGFPENVTKVSILKECDDSLRRLKTDYIDLYQLHANGLSLDLIDQVIDALETLKDQGKIRTYGWSTDYYQSADTFLKKSSGQVIQFDQNVFRNNHAMVSVLNHHGVIGLCRQPLAMGLLTGKFHADSLLPKDDIRSSGVEWLDYFDRGRPNVRYLKMIQDVKDILTADGRSLAQGSLAWILSSHEALIPIPGFKTTNQVIQNVGTLDFPPLSQESLSNIDRLIPKMNVAALPS